MARLQGKSQSLREKNCQLKLSNPRIKKRKGRENIGGENVMIQKESLKEIKSVF
jgi:hypothetical protein